MKLVKCSEGDVKVVEGNKTAKNGNFSNPNHISNETVRGARVLFFTSRNTINIDGNPYIGNMEILN